MEKNTHYFYAVKLSKEVKDLLFDQCKSLKKHLSFGRWVHEGDYHITLAFLGNAPKDKLQSSIDLVQKEVEGVGSFPLVIDQLGTFGKESSPRIFWADVRKEDRLQQVRDKVFSACGKAGFELEKRPFRAHITLARKWTGDAPFSKEQLTSLNSLSESPIIFIAEEVVLYQTHLDRTPKYEPVRVFPLQG